MNLLFYLTLFEKSNSQDHKAKLTNFAVMDYLEVSLAFFPCFGEYCQRAKMKIGLSSPVIDSTTYVSLEIWRRQGH